MRIALVVSVAGCLSLTQAEPPPPERWHIPDQPCSESKNEAIAAGSIGGVALAGAITMFAITEGDNGEYLGEDFEARMWGALLIPIGIGYTLDAINAVSDSNTCRRYREHVRELRSRPIPPE